MTKDPQSIKKQENHQLDGPLTLDSIGSVYKDQNQYEKVSDFCCC